MKFAKIGITWGKIANGFDLKLHYYIKFFSCNMNFVTLKIDPRLQVIEESRAIYCETLEFNEKYFLMVLDRGWENN